MVSDPSEQAMQRINNVFFSYFFSPAVILLCSIGVIFLASLYFLPQSQTARKSGKTQTRVIKRPETSNVWAHVASFLLPLIFFIMSTPPSIGPVDAGSLSLAAWLPGVAHPPGFPLNLVLGLLGHAMLFATQGMIPVSIAYILNLTCGLGGALTVHLIWRCDGC